jgi:LysM repeat protein
VTERIADPGVVCPFVAFDDDRDHRGPGPDHRHRCFAESPAAPRALAHQAAYCLSTSFPGCPTFVDWARREAAPVRLEAPVRSLRDAPAPRGAAAAAGSPGDAATRQPPAPGPAEAPAFLAARATRAGAGPAGEEAWAPPRGEPADDEGPADDAAALPDGAPDDRHASPDERQGPPQDAYAPPGERYAPPAERYAPPAEPGAPSVDRYAEARRMPVGYAPVAASRADRRPVAGGSGRPAREHRDPAAPSWEEPRRLESYPTLKSRGAGGIPRPLAIALIVLFAGVALFAAPFLLQGLTGGGDGATPTPAPTASSEPTPTPAPTPEPTPEEVVHVVKAGDTLSAIAAQYNVTVDEILAANPQIKNANQIAVGDRITIPQAEPSDGEVTPEP